MLVVERGDGVLLTLPLDRMAVFDCRTDCWTDVKADLSTIDASDALCLVSEMVSGTERPWKLWVDRAGCIPGPSSGP